jgi:phage terminase small subunit
MRGRPPIPTELHRVRGTYREHRHGRGRAGEPVAEGDLSNPPRELTSEQKKAWRYAIAHAPAGLLHLIDRDLLLLWVVTRAHHAKAQRLLEEAETGEAWVASRCHGILNETTKLLLQLVGQLGFSPAARPRLRVEEKTEIDVDNPWNILRIPATGSNWNPTGRPAPLAGT